jgi:hypothetical protein
VSEGECGGPKEEDTAEHKRMLKFAREAALEPIDGQEVELHEQVNRALSWMKDLSVEKIIAKREKAIRLIEERANKFRKKGTVRRWLSLADTHAAVIAHDVNGPLMWELCKQTGFGDTGCIESFRTGAPITGRIPAAATATPHEYPRAADAAQL